jgi:hypothetical protein
MPTVDTAATSILETLQTVRKGALVFDLSQKAEELVKAIRETGKGGRLTMRLDFKPMKEGDGNIILIEDEVTAKIPAPSQEATIMFTTKANTLSRKDPRQDEFKGEGFDA